MSNGTHITVLVDNATTEGYCSEWGLSLYLRHNETNLILDFGQSDAFAQNATRLGINLASVDFAVLSHAHYDHANGMDAFFRLNSHAPLFLSEACAENCWSTKANTADPHYIGIQPGLMERFRARLRTVPTGRVTTIAPGMHLVPHSTPGLSSKGERDGMLLRTHDGWLPDGFLHEVSLVIELDNTPNGRLAVFNSCSHAGLCNIVHEVKDAFPNGRVSSFVGGLHLFQSTDEHVRAVAYDIHLAGIDQVYTGHCTGDRAFELLGHELPSRITLLHPGLSFALPSDSPLFM